MADQAGIEAFLAAQQGREPFRGGDHGDLGMPYVDGRKVAAGVRAAASPDTHRYVDRVQGQRLIAENEVPPQVDRVLPEAAQVGERIAHGIGGADGMRLLSSYAVGSSDLCRLMASPYPQP